jgi:hypothetical protein
MSIETHSGGKILTHSAPPTWGEVVPDGQVAVVIRFIVGQNAVTFPISQFKRWEHTMGLPETLTLLAGNEQITIEGKELGLVRAALDLGRLCELRVNFYAKSGARPGPQIRRIAIEPL